jgi:hypothetical protein
MEELCREFGTTRAASRKVKARPLKMFYCTMPSGKEILSIEWRQRRTLIGQKFGPERSDQLNSLKELASPTEFVRECGVQCWSVVNACCDGNNEYICHHTKKGPRD